MGGGTPPDHLGRAEGGVVNREKEGVKERGSGEVDNKLMVNS